MTLLRSILLIIGLFLLEEGPVHAAEIHKKLELSFSQIDYPHTELERISTLTLVPQTVHRSSDQISGALALGEVLPVTDLHRPEFSLFPEARVAAYLDAIYPSHHFW